MTSYKGEGEMRGKWEGISLHICPSVLQINRIICTLLPQNCGLYSMWFDDVLGGPLTFQLHVVHSTLSTACPVGDVYCWVQGYRGDALVGPAHWGDNVCSAAGDVQ